MACLLVGRPGGAAAPAPVQLELVWLEPAILEDAHLLVLSLWSAGQRHLVTLVTSLGQNSQVEHRRAGHAHA